MPVFASISSLTFSPASAVPLNPCSGVNTFCIVIPAFCKVSIKWVLPRVAVWLVNKPTLLFFNKGKYSLV